MTIVYGGAFNPPTIAHEEIIKLLHYQFNPNRLVLVPSSDDYSKHELVNYTHRFNMLKIMCNNFSFPYEISKIEETNQFLGTINLLKHFEKEDSDLWFVVGSDHLNILNTWIDYEELLKNYSFIIITRPNYKLNLYYLNKYQTKYKILELDINVSSTEIRNDLKKLKDKLPNGVFSYIIKNKLYQSEGF